MIFKLSPLSFSHFPKIISSLKILAKFEYATGEWRYIYREQWPHSLVSWVRACAAALLTTTSANSCDQHIHCAPPVAYLYSATVEAVCVPHKNERGVQRGWGLVFLKSCRVVLPLSANAAQHASRQWKDSPPWVILPRAVCRRAWWHTSGVHCSALPSPSPPHTALPASLLFTLTFPFPLLFLFLFLKKKQVVLRSLTCSPLDACLVRSLPFQVK